MPHVARGHSTPVPTCVSTRHPQGITGFQGLRASDGTLAGESVVAKAVQELGLAGPEAAAAAEPSAPPRNLNQVADNEELLKELDACGVSSGEGWGMAAGLLQGGAGHCPPGPQSPPLLRPAAGRPHREPQERAQARDRQAGARRGGSAGGGAGAGAPRWLGRCGASARSSRSR